MKQATIQLDDSFTQAEINEPAAAQMDDLHLTDAELDDLKGGPCFSVGILLLANGTPSTSNHNETLAEDTAPTDNVEDLQLTEEESNSIKGGPICHGTTVLAWARVDGVSPQSNHNETVMEEAVLADHVEDLPLTAAQETSVKAGTGWGSSAYQYAYNDPSFSRPPVAENLVRP